MDTDLTAQLTTMRLAMTQQSAGIALIKKQHEMQQELVAMISEAAHAPPPPGQGARVDRWA